MLAHLNEMIKDSDKLTTTRRAELRGAISTKPGLNRYLPSPPAGCCGSTPPPSRPMRTSAASTCSAAPDPELPAEDIALGYKQLRQVERGWRDLKQVIDLRPVYHRKEERIRAHVILCWLALLLIWITETTTGVT